MVQHQYITKKPSHSSACNKQTLINTACEENMGTMKRNLDSIAKETDTEMIIGMESSVK